MPLYLINNNAGKENLKNEVYEIYLNRGETSIIR